MQLLYDARDDAYHERVGSRILYWLDDLGAVPLEEANPSQEGFLFTGARPIEDYRELIARLPLVQDRADAREPLLRLDSALLALAQAQVRVLSPKSWILPLDSPLPKDLTFPLFVRTAESSWKKGGEISKVSAVNELNTEASELRRVLGWNAVIIVREWIDLAVAGHSRYGPVAQEVRVWIVDGDAVAWSFHHVQFVPNPAGFPPSGDDIETLRVFATAIGTAFRSRLVAADFGRGIDGRWWFIEAGPGSCAGTANEAVFKAVASRLCGEKRVLRTTAVGGAFCDC